MRAQTNHSESGVAMTIAIFFSILTIGMIMSGTVVLDSLGKKSKLAFQVHGQARQFAEAGLVDGLGWFRRQTSQPVLTFAPIRDEEAIPPILDTEDPAIGLVKEFKISKGVYGRYELRKFVANSNPLEPEVLDISNQRGADSMGSVWRLVSRGIIFKRVDLNQPYNVAPNHVIANDVVETEIRRLSLSPPSQAAICARNGSLVDIAVKGKVSGGIAAGIAYPSSSGNPSGAVRVSGSPALAPLTEYNDSIFSVFAVDEDTFRSIADLRVSTNEGFPDTVPTASIVHAETDLIFDASRPLKGNGIVYVKGNVQILAGSNSFFNGVLYVDGALTIRAPALLSGTIIVTGALVISGQGDLAEVIYDDAVLNNLLISIGQYRFSTSIYEQDLRGSLKY